MYLNNISKVGGFEMSLDGQERSSAGACPKEHNIECQTDVDCTNKIVKGSPNEHCSKCVCWHVPVCDIKK